MIVFTSPEGTEVRFDKRHGLHGDRALVSAVLAYIESGSPAGCNYWGEVEPGLDSPWQAYLTICGALTALFGIEPNVVGVPLNPDGYEPEGVVE